jgi:dihydropyrimidinase
MRFDLLIRNGTAVFPDSEPAEVDVAVQDGKVAALVRRGHDLEAANVVDASGMHIFPGVIDPHMHIGLGNETAEDWATETQSAAIGGVTSGFNYLMSGESYFPVIEEHLAAARKYSLIDFGFHPVPSAPIHLEELHEYHRKHGIQSFKYFTSYRGDEGKHLNIQGTDDGFLFRYFQQVRDIEGGIACIHPENIEVVWELRRRLQEAGRDDLKAWEESRPQVVEAQSAHAVCLYAQEVGCPVYIVHVSGAMVLDEILSVRDRYKNSPIYIETCPHFLTHTSNDNIGLLGKVNPPLRYEEDIEALWEAIDDGEVDTIGSDHNSRKRERKTGSVWTCSAGFPGSASILPVMLSEGVHKRGLSLSRVAEVTSRNPAMIFGISPRKGTIAVGSDADFAIVDLNKEKIVTPDMFQSHSDYSLYEGWALKGWPVMTILRGQVVMRDGEIVGTPGGREYFGEKNATN